MLRVGLTGGLGSGKSTAARMFRELGAHVIEADAIGRELMRPGEAVYAAIVGHFGPGVVLGGVAGELDRAALARIAFAEGRVEELNAIVHPAVIRRQAEIAEAIGAREPGAVVMVESALIFETKYGETKYGETKYGERGSGQRARAPWRARFDRLILVRAAEERKVARYVGRVGAGTELTGERVAALEAEARRRLAAQMGDDAKAELVDFVLTNDGDVRELEWQVDRLWLLLAGERMGGG